MKNIFFILPVLFAYPSILAQAQWDLNWIKVDSGAYGESFLDKPTPGLTLKYEDPKSPTGESLVMNYSYLVNLSKPSPEHNYSRSLAYQLVFNCKTTKSAIQTMTGFSGTMAKGRDLEIYFPKEQLNWQTLNFVNVRAVNLLTNACNSKFVF